MNNRIIRGIYFIPELMDLLRSRKKFSEFIHWVKFSVLTSSILYLEGADNYVYIYYTENGKVKREVL